MFAVPACVSNTDFQYLRRDVSDLKRSSVDTKKEVDVLKDRTASIVKEDSFTAMQEGQASINSRLSELTSGLQELRGRFEENKYFFEKTYKDTMSEKDVLKAQIAGMETQVKALKDRLTLLEEQAKKQNEAKLQPEAAAAASGQQGKPDQAPAAQQGQQAAETVEPAADKTGNPYEEALQAFHDKQYKKSREKFEAYLKNSPKPDLADNAHFWIAETYYGEKDYESAILAYETMLKKFPQSEKTPEAMRKQGFAFLEIGDRKTGKIILDKLIQKFPSSKDAELAKKKLAETDVKKPAKKK